jgi:transposase InsO family protein
MNNGKPKTVMHDNGKQFTSKAFKHFLVHNNIGDKRIPNFYPQMQGKIEAYNKIVKNEFLALEDIPNIEDGKLRYDMLSRRTTKLENMEESMVLHLRRCFYKV